MNLPVRNKINLAWLALNAKQDVRQNLATVNEMMPSLVQLKSDLVVLPEAFAFLSADLMRQQTHVEVLGDLKAPLQAACANWASQLSAYVVAGSLPLQIGQHIYATLCVFAPDGRLETYYRKMHLFSVVTPQGDRYQEDRFFTAGPDPVMWHSPWGPIGLAICYDLRFPAMFRYYAQAGARLMLLPSAFTAETGKAHWHTLVRARAIENQAFMLAVNQLGKHDDQLQTYGHSLLVDPWGRVVDDSAQHMGIMSAQIDLSSVESLRVQFPVLHNAVNRIDSCFVMA